MADLGDNLSPQTGAPPALKQGKNMGPKHIAAKTRRILLEENENIPSVGLVVGVNGYHYLIKPGMVIDCPIAVIEVLNNAVLSVPVIDQDTMRITGFRERMRFNYRNMDLAA